MNARLWVLACAGLLALSAGAQTFTPDKRLLLSDGVLRGSPRLMGIAGAFVGVAEGAEGITRNPAAAVTKDPHFDSDFNVDFGAALHFLPPWAGPDQDWDNDGKKDLVDPQGPAELSFLGTQVIYLASSVQYKNVALGLGLDLQNFITKTGGGDSGGPESFFNLNLAHLFGSLAVSLWMDQILVGIGVESTHALILYGEQQPGERLPTRKGSNGYHGWGIQFGGLWRPKDEDYRLGFAFRPQTIGDPVAPLEPIGPEGGKLTPFSKIVAPARISLGGSWALGPGRHYNITGKGGWMELPEKDAEGNSQFTTAMTKWLLTTQLDVFLPVQDATYASAFLEQNNGGEILDAGYQLALEPRIAMEKEAIADRLRLWLGGYLEPPLVKTAPAVRPHVTFGFELYLFKLTVSRISFGLSFDFAKNYENLSVAFLIWK